MADVLPLRSRASLDGVTLQSTQTECAWFGLRDDLGRVYAVAGMMPVARGLRIKGVWVAPHARGHGAGTELAEHLIGLAEDASVGCLEVLAWNPAFYEARGFQRVAGVAGGPVRLRRFL